MWAFARQIEVPLQFHQSSYSQLTTTTEKSSVNITENFIIILLTTQQHSFYPSHPNKREFPKSPKKRKNCGSFEKRKNPPNNYSSTIQRFNFQTNESNISPQNSHQRRTALKQFKLKKVTEFYYKFILDENLELEIQPIYLCNDKSENAKRLSSPDNQLPNNVLDYHDAIKQLIASNMNKWEPPEVSPSNTHPTHQSH